jgi:hypothetical protein
VAGWGVLRRRFEGMRAGGSLDPGP